MTLSALMKKGGLRGVATAIPANAATEEGKTAGTVARVATVAVATPPITASNTTAMTANEEKAIRAWLEHIEETDAAIIAVVLDRCRMGAGARDYFIGRSGEVTKPVSSEQDDRRTCRQCVNLRGMVCTIAQLGGVVSARRGYTPISDISHRCAGYAPGADDPDRRSGQERWPGLIQKEGNHENT